jgi:hypothetical protein
MPNAKGETHAQTARRLTVYMPAGVFAHAARDAVVDRDYSMLERMFPGMTFDAVAIGPDRWALNGTGRDGSIVTWEVGE